VPERLAHGFVRSIGEVELHRGPGCLGLFGQHRVGLLLRGEQRFNALAQRNVLCARPVQENGAFRKRPLPHFADNPSFSNVRRKHANR
jgi:hypothetical protein